MEAKIKATGEIVDVVPDGMMSIQTAAYKTPDGRKIPSTALGYPKVIDWEERRYEIAKEVLSNFWNDRQKGEVYDTDDAVATSIYIADKLIKHLKGEAE